MRPGKVLGVLAAYNVVQNALLTERGYVPANLTMTAIGLRWALNSELAWSEVGLNHRDIVSGLKLGLGVAAGASVLVVLVSDLPRTAALANTETLPKLSGREHWFRCLVRYPLGTALFEEVWFRGLLTAALRRHGVRHPEVLSATAFAAWHLIPTASAIGANRAGRTLGWRRKTMLVIAGSLTAGTGGLGFSKMQNLSSSLTAPWLAHATFNGLGHWMMVRQSRAGGSAADFMRRGLPRQGESR